MAHSLQNTIHDIYDAALHPEMWEGTLAKIADLMHAGPVELALMDPAKPEPDFTADCRIIPEAMDDYFQNIYQVDKRIPRMLALPDRGGILTEQLLTSEEWEHSGELRNFLERNETGNLVASNATTKGLITWLGIGRKGYNNPFTPEELAIYNIMLQHVTRALRIHMTERELKLRADGLGGTLSLEDKAVVFLDQNAKVIFSNELAIRLANERTIRLTNDRLALRDIHANKKLTTGLHSLAKGLHDNRLFQEVMIFQNSSGCEYGLRLLPLCGDMLNGDGRVTQQNMVIISNLDTMRKPGPAEISRFASLFGLTLAETRVVEAVATMKELSDYAKARGVSIDTPRKQLKSAMEKIGVHSQKELLRRLERFCFIQMR